MEEKEEEELYKPYVQDYSCSVIALVSWKSRQNEAQRALLTRVRSSSRTQEKYYDDDEFYKPYAKDYVCSVIALVSRQN